MKMARLVLSLIALVAVLALPVTAQAGGWVVITLDRVPTGIQPGVPFTVGFVARQHGVRPLDGLTPKITASNGPTGTVTALAKPDGKPGHYVATLTLPSAGQWDWEIDTWHKTVMSPLLVGVAAAAEAPNSAAAAAAPARRDAPASTPQTSLLIAAAALAGLATVATVVARRRRLQVPAHS
jgi:hypothetical protein